MNKAAFRGFFLAALAAGLAFRLVWLDARPMHHDEANQAVKFGALLEKGEYRYDPADHHGPTLYYLTLPAAWARGQKTLASLDETTLRIVPSLFGAGLILLFLLLAKGLGRTAVVWAAGFAAISPALTYYSRFYIQETLFVFFAWGFLFALGRYVLRPGPGWALGTGLFAGAAFASKETAVIVFASGGAALVTAFLFSKKARPAAKLGHIGLALISAAGVAGLFFSSFLRNPRGIIYSLSAFKDYFARGTEAGIHNHPWSYYLQTLAWTKSEGVVWSEALILGLALLGILAALRPKKAVEPGEIGLGGDGAKSASLFWTAYLAAATVLMAVIFSALPYKTPWNLAVFQAGFVLLAGIGAAFLIKAVRPAAARAAVILFLLAGAAQLVMQADRANFRYPADPRNPYAYAQTSPDFLRLVERVRALSAFHPDRKDMLIKVVAGPYEQWPLPWYLRDFPRVGYWTTLAEAGGTEGVPVLIASEHAADVLSNTVGEAFQSEYFGLRPGTLLTLFIDRPLWEAFRSDRLR